MRRIILACVLATLAVCGHAADSVLYLGPDGAQLKPGKYWRATIGIQNGEPVITSKTVVLDIGGIAPPPPPDDVTKQIAGFISAVTADPKKAETSKGLALAYSKIQEVAATGVFKNDAAILRKATEAVIDAALADPSVGKTATWRPFTDGMKALTAPMDFVGVLAAYKIAQAQLGGAPPPPPPETTAVKAVILIESENQKPKQAALLNQMRNEPAWSKLIEVLDPNVKTEKGTSDPLTQAAVKACGSNPLPRVILLDEAGLVVGDSLPLPETCDALKETLTGLGVKP